MRRLKTHETTVGQLGIAIGTPFVFLTALFGVMTVIADMVESVYDPAPKHLKNIESMRHLPAAAPGECYYAMPGLRTDFNVSATGSYKIVGVARKISPFHEAVAINQATIGSLPAYTVKSCAILDVDSPDVFLSRESVLEENREAIETLANNYKALIEIYPNVTSMYSDGNTTGKKLDIWHP